MELIAYQILRIFTNANGKGIFRNQKLFTVLCIGKIAHTRKMTDKLSTIIRKAQDHNLLDYAEIDIILSDIEHIGKLLNRVASDLQKLFDKFQPQTQSIKNSSTASSYAIENKTDFIKIISAMYDCRMFKTIDGNIASNKKETYKNIRRVF